MEELSCVPSNLTVIFCDNKSTISMTKNLMFHGISICLSWWNIHTRETYRSRERERDVVKTMILIRMFPQG